MTDQTDTTAEELQHISAELQQMESELGGGTAPTDTTPTDTTPTDTAPTDIPSTDTAPTLLVRVRHGETLEQVAARTRRDIASLKTLNPNGPVGNKVRIPL